MQKRKTGTNWNEKRRSALFPLPELIKNWNGKTGTSIPFQFIPVPVYSCISSGLHEKKRNWNQSYP